MHSQYSASATCKTEDSSIKKLSGHVTWILVSFLLEEKMFCRKRSKDIHSKPKNNNKAVFRKDSNHSEEDVLLNSSLQSPTSGSGSPFSPLNLSPLSGFSRVLSLSSPQAIDRSHHNLERLPQDLLRISNAQMKELNLSSNNINSLPGSFYNLVRLVRLNLSDNQLVRLSSEIELLSNLEYLNISRKN